MKRVDYDDLSGRIEALCAGEDDPVAVMATIVHEVHVSDDRFDWVGFYRAVGNETLKIGPFQGGHGCLTIPYSNGVCGRAARSGEVQIVPDVEAFDGHIACAASTRSELVVPFRDRAGALCGVLDIDSNMPDAFGPDDALGFISILDACFRHGPVMKWRPREDSNL